MRRGRKLGTRETKKKTTKNPLSKYMGVRKAWHYDGQWMAKITEYGQSKSIGRFKTERDAAIAVDVWKIEHNLPPVNILKPKS